MTESYTGWSRRDTCGASSSGYVDKNVTWRAKEYEHENHKDEGQEKGKEEEQEHTQEKSLSITGEDRRKS